jgi:hypothetical protein
VIFVVSIGGAEIYAVAATVAVQEVIFDYASLAAEGSRRSDRLRDGP